MNFDHFIIYFNEEPSFFEETKFCSHQIKTDITGVERAGGERKVQNSVLHEHGLRATSQKISRPKPAKKKHFDCKLNSFHKKTIIINYLILIKNWSCYV